MSSKKSRLDLLVRVRYLNPIPPPPFPPKLFQIPTDIHRLGEPSYLDQLASSTPLPMLVDSEMGMHLNLNEFNMIWEGDDGALNPVSDMNFAPDPADALLLAPIRPKTESVIPVEAKTTAQGQSEVSWMRTSNLFTRKIGAKKSQAGITKTEPDVDASLGAQALTVDKTFTDLESSITEEMRHPDPKRSHLRVVDTYDILPDAETWGNKYCLVRFPERPSGSTEETSMDGASLSRLSHAVIRPVREDDQQFMEYYLPSEGDLEKLGQAHDDVVDAERLEKIREIIAENADDPRLDGLYKHVIYDRIRAYEVTAQDRPDREVLLALDERPAKRRKGAYYKPIDMRTRLRKSRVKSSESWDRARVGIRAAFNEERERRTEAAASATDPGWINEQLRQIRDVHDSDRLGEGMETT